MRASPDTADMADDMAATRGDATDVGNRRLAAFQRLADRHLDDGYRLARAILRNPADAQDATHDAVIQAWRGWPSLRDESRFEGWFSRILVNTCRDKLRRVSRRQTIDIEEMAEIAGTDGFGSLQDRDVIGTAMQKLSPDHQVVLALRYYSDLSVNEISTRTGVRVGTVQSRLHYALRHMRSEIERADREGATR